MKFQQIIFAVSRIIQVLNSLEYTLSNIIPKSLVTLDFLKFLIVQIKAYIQGFQMRYQSFLGQGYSKRNSWFSDFMDIPFVLIATVVIVQVLGPSPGPNLGPRPGPSPGQVKHLWFRQTFVTDLHLVQTEPRGNCYPRSCLETRCFQMRHFEKPRFPVWSSKVGLNSFMTKLHTSTVS